MKNCGLPFRQGEVNDTHEIIEIVKTSGALAYCRDKAMQESEIARQAVLTLPDSQYRQGLLDLMTLASQRLY